MGDMAEYYDEREDDFDGLDSVEYRRPALRLAVQDRATHCHPSCDEDAQALIESLGTYAWETRKVDGKYTAEPYSLHATIDGHAYVIHLPGRFGTTLSWLKRKVGAA